MEFARHPDLSTMRDHWIERPAWRTTRRRLTWLLMPAASDPVREIAAIIRPTLDTFPDLVAVADADLHLTLADAGSWDRADPEQAAVEAARVMSSLPPAPGMALSFARLALAHEGIVCEGVPPEWASWWADVQAIIAPHRPAPSSMWVHLALAYARGEQEVAPLESALAPIVSGFDDGVSDLPPGGAPRLVLALQTRHQHRYAAEPLLDIPLP